MKDMDDMKGMNYGCDVCYKTPIVLHYCMDCNIYKCDDCWGKHNGEWKCEACRKPKKDTASAPIVWQ